MKRFEPFPILELTLMLGAAGVGAFLPGASSAPDGLLWFLAGLSILKLSDVWLPRGDTVGMSSALALGALLLFDVRTVLVSLVVAETIALAPPGRGQKWRSALPSLSAEAVSVVVCSSALVPLGLHPTTGVLLLSGKTLRPEQYAALILVGLLFAALEFSLLQVETAVRDNRPIRSSILGSASYGAWLIAAQASAGILSALMYRKMGAWGLVVGVVMILIMRQSFVLLLEIRRAYNSTIDVLISAMEAQSPGREGVAERHAELCTRVGRAIGLHGRELERLRYAALLMGVGIDESVDTSPLQLDARRSSKIVEGVEFLQDVTPLLRICEDPDDKSSASRSDLVCSYILMSAGVATRTLNVHQLKAIRERVSPRIVREVDAVVGALVESASDMS
ncbi:MAG TPA: hypothetical protein VGK50_03160 [Coriobacteriia bacterium]|jgi:hypothetical protein